MDINKDDIDELLQDNEVTNDGDNMTSVWHLLHPHGSAPVSLQLVPGAGRGLVASRDLKPGELVLRDQVLLQNISSSRNISQLSEGASDCSIRAECSL